MRLLIERGDLVKAIVDRDRYKRGDIGLCLRTEGIDSEAYITVRFNDGRIVGPVLADSFEPIARRESHAVSQT